mgnify:CR=1 FL=1
MLKLSAHTTSPDELVEYFLDISVRLSLPSASIHTSIRVHEMI